MQVFQIILLILRYAGQRQHRLFQRLLASGQFGRLFNLTQAGVIADEDDDDDSPYRRRMRRRPDPNRFPKVPSDNGIELMNSGIFGLNEAHKDQAGDLHSRKRLARRILDRELATPDHVHQRLNHRLMAQVSYFRLSEYT